MRRHMDRIYGLWESPGRGVLANGRDFPALNLYETADDYVLTAEVPGVEGKGIDITVLGDTLTVKGKREPETDFEKVDCHRRERDFGSFSRAITLPSVVDGDRVEATYVDGVLQVKLPKAEETKPKVIQVQS